jgi:predicted transcriptional regulator
MANSPPRIDWREVRRFRALDLKNEGWTHDEIAEALDVSKTAVSQWMKAAREDLYRACASCSNILSKYLP